MGHEEEDACHTEGAALMLSHETQNAVISCEGSHMHRSKQRKKTPSSTSFSATHPQTTILMGDLNTKIGSDNSGYEEVMGGQGVDKMTTNDEMLADFCAFNKMIIGGSVFSHRRIHKATWVSPDNRTEKQIDHICIGRKFSRSMQDVRVQIVAVVASDHRLVLVRMKMKLKKREVNRSTRSQYNMDFLKDRVTMKNKYEALQDLLDEGNLDIDT